MDEKDWSTFKTHSDDKLEEVTTRFYDHERRISKLETKVEDVGEELKEISVHTKKVETSLEDLITQSKSATAYLKGILWSLSLFGLILTVLNSLGYLKLPSADSDKQEGSSTKLKE